MKNRNSNKDDILVNNDQIYVARKRDRTWVMKTTGSNALVALRDLIHGALGIEYDSPEY